MSKIKEINRIEIKGIKKCLSLNSEKINNIYFVLNLFIIMNCIIGISSKINKIISNKRQLDTNYQYIKLKVNTTRRTWSIPIIGNNKFGPPEIYCNEEKIKYDVINKSHIYNEISNEIRINKTSCGNWNEIKYIGITKYFQLIKCFFIVPI